MSTEALRGQDRSQQYSTFDIDGDGPDPRPTAAKSIYPVSTSFSDFLIPKETGDMKVLWAIRTLVSISVVAFLCAACEVWIMVNEATIKNNLLGSVKSNGAYDIWLNFKVELTYHSVFLVSIGFWVFIVHNAIMHQNFIQVIAVNFYNGGLFIYSILQILQTANDLNRVRSEVTDASVASNSGYFLAAQVLLPSIIGLYFPVFAFLTYKLFQEFGWRMYRITGGDKVITRVFTTYHILLLLLKFCAFSGTAFLVITLVLTSITPKGIIMIPVIGGIIGLSTVICGFFASRFEIRLLMALFIAGCMGIFGYIINRFVDAFKRGGSEFERAKIPFIMFGIMSELMWLTAIVFAVICWMNFGKGLKGVLDQEHRRRKGQYVAPPHVIE
ncbi:UNVERIFIED_CONTAM: hypothetical protein HDU68_008063 [Siphonaria sp. JEL0065]|nr:hypothetical protein HDU68_008063 [Siphonaria sp. JEL0065]